MLTENVFRELIGAASLAPSADNMQPWEFSKNIDSIDVFCDKSRFLPTDVIGMFGWIGVGAAIQNIVVKASSLGFCAQVRYNSPDDIENLAANIQLISSDIDTSLANYIGTRNTNRNPYESTPLSIAQITQLTKSINGFQAGVHWTTNMADLNKMVHLDANSSYIRLEHKPLHDELFSILRFSRKEFAKKRFGLSFESLGVPPLAVLVARQLRFWSVNQLISSLGIGRLVAKSLAVKLKQAGALCLITVYNRNPISYMEAGRALEQLWLTATETGLSVQPYGVIPQYLTKVDIEPETFLPKHRMILNSHRKPFFSIFPKVTDDYPAILLRIGKTAKPSVRSDYRLKPGQIIR